VEKSCLDLQGLSKRMYTKRTKKTFQPRNSQKGLLKLLVVLTLLLSAVLSQSCSKPKVESTTAAKAAEKKPEEVKKPAETKKDPRSYFTVNKDGSVKTKSGKAEKTFNFPDIKVGFIFLAPQLDVLPVLSVEIHEFEKVPFYFDFGIAPHLLYFSVGYNIIPIFEVGVFLWAGWNFIDWKKKFWGHKFYGACFGVGMTVIKF